MKVNNSDQLEIIFDSVIDIIFLVAVEENERYRFTSVNRAFCQATGLGPEMVVGKYVNDIIPGTSREMVLSNYRNAVKTGETVQWEETSAYPAGVKTGIVSVTPVFNENKECIMLVGTVHDITERKRTEEEKEQMRHQLNERIKELTTLYKASQLLLVENKALDKVLQEMVSLIPAGWQYPEITEARILADNKEFKSKGYKAGNDTIVATFTIPGGKSGKIEVQYTRKMKQEQEGPFLTEERKLIDTLADMLGGCFQRSEVTEQLLLEKELSEIIINSLPGIFYMFTDKGKYLRWNKNHETVPGYSTIEMENMYPLNFFDHDEKGLIEERIGKVFTEGEADAEANFMAKDGKKIPYYFTGKRIMYHDIPCLLGVGLDMTERRKMEMELRHAEIKFRTLVEKSQVGVYIIQQKKIVYANPGLAEIFGYGPDELIGMNPIETIISEEYREVVREKAREGMEVESVHYEVAGKRKDGSLNRVEIFATLIAYEGLPTVMGTMVDITQRKLAEEALRKSEANLHTIFDSTDTIYALLDNNFQLVSFNQQAANFVEKELQGRISLHANFISYFPKERQPELYNKMKQVLAGKSFAYESSYRQPDGRFHWYYMRMFPITDIDKKVFGLMIAVSDITDKKRLEEAIVNQKVEEQKKMTRAVLNAQESERNKIGQELHDNVNQILIGSKIHLGLIADVAGRDGELIANSIQLIDQAIHEIQSLTRQQVTPHKEIDLEDLVQSLVKHLDSAKISTRFTYHPGKLLISDDLKLNVYRIIQEATNNIVKHATAKNAAISIIAAGAYLEIVIADDGRGFDINQTKKQGIGLSNLMNRVDSYNGTVFIKTAPGEGCTINLSIPA